MRPDSPDSWGGLRLKRRLASVDCRSPRAVAHSLHCAVAAVTAIGHSPGRPVTVKVLASLVARLPEELTAEASAEDPRWLPICIAFPGAFERSRLQAPAPGKRAASGWVACGRTLEASR